ncbi:hypothetical protein AOT82_2064 [Psychrobacter sp. AntiMn-1]|nr:hypothetical protein AOT82_2064 [Psychrobacter sp. AntiMn-1]
MLSKSAHDINYFVFKRLSPLSQYLMDSFLTKNSNVLH